MNSIRNRIELAKYFNQLRFEVGAEVGVADGRYAEILCENIPGLRLWAVDPWMPYDGNWRSKEYQDGAYKKALERLDKYNVVIMPQISMEACRTIEDDSLDFVFIDGDHHFDFIMEDIINWTRKVRKGGIVSGHDYYPFSSGGVITAVDAYVKAHGIDLQITPRNEDGHKDDRVPCWWFVKE